MDELKALKLLRGSACVELPLSTPNDVLGATCDPLDVSKEIQYDVLSRSFRMYTIVYM